MRFTKFLPLFTLITASLSPLAVEHSVASDLLGNLTGYAPVAFQYSCPKTTGTLPACSTSFTIPAGKTLVIQSVSGSATPLNPTATGTFPTGQASMSITTQLGNDSPVPNLIGPNYALTGSQIWFFTNLLTLYTDDVPAVANNGGPVYIQGYVYNR